MKRKIFKFEPRVALSQFAHPSQPSPACLKALASARISSTTAALRTPGMLKGIPSADQMFKKKGQAMLVSILVIFTAAVAISLAVAIIGFTQTSIISHQNLSYKSDNLAEACLENALMRMTRADLTVPPSLFSEQGECKIEISGSNPYQFLITSEYLSTLWKEKKVTKKFQVGVLINNGVTTITSWQEIY